MLIKNKLIALTDEVVKLPNFEGNYKKYKVNVDHLFLNPFNDRFAMELSESENLNGVKIGYDTDSQKSLQKLLWDSSEDKNKKTMQDILKNGVLRDIVIDLSGTVLDGNRRVSIIRKILEKNANDINITNRFQYVEVVLIERLLNENEIREFETTLQMSEDEKLEYNPINVYLKIESLFNTSQKKDEKSKIADVANKMGAKYNSTDISKKLKVFNEMKIYLSEINNQKHLRMLDERQDMFVQLLSFKENFNSKKIKCEYDINFQNYRRVRNILNILIALKYETHKFRAIIPGIKNVTKSPLSTISGLKMIEELFETEGINRMFAEYRTSRLNSDDNNIDKIAKNIFTMAERAMESSGKSADVESSINSIEQSTSNLLEWSSKGKSTMMKPSQKQTLIEEIERAIAQLEKLKRSLEK